jgi:dolichol-phosphate mannosyltransferase
MNAVVVATYNEAVNAPALVRRIREVDPSVAIILVDDNSPDGTARIVNELGFPDVTVLVRKDARGYGTAVRDGLLKALEIGADRIVTMDADFSHDPKELPAMFAALDKAHVAVGSRYTGGVRVLNWAMKRLLLSLFANFYVRTILGLPAQDCTSGYRAYRRQVLQRMGLRSLQSNGYSFLVEMLWRAHRRRARIAEVPIIFEERREGESKMSGSVIRESVLMPWLLRLRG